MPVLVEVEVLVEVGVEVFARAVTWGWKASVGHAKYHHMIHSSRHFMDTQKKMAGWCPAMVPSPR